jgi:hypothetical protein
VGRLLKQGDVVIDGEGYLTLAGER